MVERVVGLAASLIFEFSAIFAMQLLSIPTPSFLTWFHLIYNSKLFINGLTVTLSYVALGFQLYGIFTIRISSNCYFTVVRTSELLNATRMIPAADFSTAILSPIPFNASRSLLENRYTICRSLDLSSEASATTISMGARERETLVHSIREC